MPFTPIEFTPGPTTPPLVREVNIAPPQTVEPAPAADEPAPTPTRSASKADWVTFAVESGMSTEDAESMTRDELVAYYTED